MSPKNASGKPEEEENIKWIESETGGVQPMTISGRMTSERERTIGMTDSERAWRAQYLKDQELDPSEPIVPKGYEKARYNIFRRIYKYPLNRVEAMISPLMGQGPAHQLRIGVSKYAMGFLLIFYMLYNYRYHQQDNWSRQSGWKVVSSRPMLYPDHPNYPNWDHRSKGNQFATYGFENSPQL